MLATAKNYDVICLQMRNYLPMQENPMQQETICFTDKVKGIIACGAPIKPKLDQFIPQLFNFRLLALRWLTQQPDIDILHFLDHAYPSIEVLQNSPRLAVLSENILFALRCNSRVIQNMVAGENTTSEKLAEEFATAPMSTYEQFFGALAMSIPDYSIFKVISDFSHASLYIEFILIAAVLINEEKLEVSDETINELAFLIADAAQEYTAIATQIGILPTRSKSLASNTFNTSVHSVEDNLLSELGLADFALNFSNGN